MNQTDSPTPLLLDAEIQGRMDAGGSLPRAPRTLEETGVDVSLLADLCARIIHRLGRVELAALAREIRLPASVVDELLALLRAKRFVAVVGHTGIATAGRYELTDEGRNYAVASLARCKYSGPAPVSLDAYAAHLQSSSLQRPPIDRSGVHDVMRELAIEQEVIDQLGAAMNSGRAVLLYGPPGSGKTYLAEHLAGLQSGEVAVPYAIVVGGEIIQIFDPLIHEPVGALLADGLIRSDSDERWIRCRRPKVIAGGELTLQMLDLQFDPVTGFYQAPPHVKANGGLFVIDDLGRQMVTPRDLMNRWIVPLDRNRDYLTLHTGFKFCVPFDLVVVFSTNLKPSELADEAFLRRFGYKTHLGPMKPENYRRVFESVCASMDVAFDADAYEWLIEHRHRAQGRDLLACYPRDLIGRIRDFALYERHEAKVTRETLDRAWNTYFYTAPG